jgi:hypothetical protein
MKRFIIALVLLGAGAVGLGFYLGWFRIGSDNADGKSNVTLSVDTDKFQKDSKKAVVKVEDAGRNLKDKVAGPSEKSTEGTVVSVSGDKLTMTSMDGKEQDHALATNVKVTCDGQTCKAADLKAGMRIRVSIGNEAPHAATRIEALDKNAAFEKTG